MSQRCKYHPHVPARFACDQCRVELCSQCVKREQLGEEAVLCPLCGGYAASLGMGNVIKPFWQRLPRFFAYPANPASLIYISALSLVSAATYAPTLVGALMQLLVFFLILRYAYAVLNHTASGNLKPPPITYEMVTRGLSISFKQLGVFMLMGVALGVTAKTLGPGAAKILFLVELLFVPASVMVLAIEDSVVKAVNPVVLLSLVRRVGWSYLLLYFFLLLLSGGSDVADRIFREHVPQTLFVFISMFAWAYFMLITFNMMGYVIYQYHEVLGFSVDVDYEAGEGAEMHRPRHPLVDQAGVLVTEGRIEEAAALLKTKLRASAEDWEAHNYYHKLLYLARRQPDLAEHGRALIGMAIAEKHPQRALEVYRNCHEVDPELHVADGSQVLPLATFAAQGKEERLALDLLAGFDKTFPSHPDRPHARLLEATILCDKFRQDARARAILDEIVAEYPDHAVVPEAKRYIALIEKLSSRPSVGAPASPRSTVGTSR